MYSDPWQVCLHTHSDNIQIGDLTILDKNLYQRSERGVKIDRFRSPIWAYNYRLCVAVSDSENGRFETGHPMLLHWSYCPHYLVWPVCICRCYIKV